MTHFEIDAELEALLGEVARNPRATLLRVARPTAFREAFEALREVEPHATGLIAAERELLREHRAQLARLLRQACVTKIYAHPAARGRFVRYQTTAGPIEVLEPRRWRERARDELRASEPARDELEGFELLERLAAADGEIAADTAQLATATAL